MCAYFVRHLEGKNMRIIYDHQSREYKVRTWVILMIILQSKRCYISKVFVHPPCSFIINIAICF